MLRSFFPILYVRSVPESVAFYEGLLGLERSYSWPSDAEPDFVVVRLGESSLGLAAASAPEELLGVRPGESPRGELCFYTDDVDATVRELARLGVRVLREPAAMPWGERMAYVADPDGNPVQLAQAQPNE